MLHANIMSASHVLGLGDAAVVRPFPSLHRPTLKQIRVPVVAVATIGLVAALPDTLTMTGRIALGVTLLTIVGWTMTRLPDSLVALAAALALGLSGVIHEDYLYTTLGNELIWLLVAAFAMGAVIKASGLLELTAEWAVTPLRTVRGLFYALTLIIIATAFIIPSTSGRAVLLMPVFVALSTRMPDQQSTRALALLFPTVILLSAGGSLIGAGAHFIAVDTIRRVTGSSIGYAGWIALALPFAVLSSFVATWLILHLFASHSATAALVRPAAQPSSRPLTRQQRLISGILVVMVALWISAPLHGVGLTIVAIGGAVVMLSPLVTDKSPKEIFRSVEVELLLFLAATAAIAEALVTSGTDKWLAQGALSLLPTTLTGSLPVALIVLSLMSVIAHLFINSRSARAAVLIPAVALPIAGFGHDATLCILVTVLGTGFCQTLKASAKPVMIYANADGETFSQADLLRLASVLMPATVVLLFIFAMFVWPHQLAGTSAHAGAPAALTTIVRNASASPTARPSATCTHEALTTLARAEIATNQMWASGWWRVWASLSQKGIVASKTTVRSIYREQGMVRLRPYSPEIKATLANASAVAAALAACSDRAQSSLHDHVLPSEAKP